MPFTPRTWQNGPGGGTPISAAALNDLETRISTAALPDANDVGYDVFLVAGQSNAAGRGVAYDLARADVADPRIFVYGDPAGTYYPSQIAPAVEPFSAYSPENAVVLTSTAGMSFAIPFARWYVRTVPTNRMVLLVNTAWGGTAFEGAAAGNGGTRNWKVSTTGSDSLYQASITQTLAALAVGGSTSRLVGVLWHQGEQDATNGTSGATYATDLDALIDGYRTAFGNAALPFILGQQTAEALSSLAARRTIDAKHIDTPRRKLYTAFAYNVGTGLTDATNGTLHFSAAAQRLFGKKFFDALARAKANALGVLAPAPVVSVSAPDTTSVVATWTQPTGRVTDFLIEYNQGAGWTTWTHTASIDVTATITGLTAGSTVQVRVSSVNEAGTGTPSSVASVTLGGGGVPGQVTGLTLGTATSSTQPLSWTAVSGATGYTVQYALAGSGSWTTFASGVTGTSSTVTGLTASTSYDYRVTATNASGSGTPSSTATGSTAAGSGVDVDALLAEAVKRYRVSDITGVADGGIVASWGSLSSTGSTQPTLDVTNGEVVFNGTNNRLDDTTVTQSTSVTAALVGRLTAVPTTKNHFMLGATSTSGTSGQQQIGAALSTGLFLTTAGGTINSGVTADTVQHVHVGVFDATNGASRVDNTEVTGNTGGQSRVGIRLGCSAGGTPIHCPCRIKQAIFWNRILTAPERAALSTYLQANPA